MTNGWNGQPGSIPTGSTQWDSSWPKSAERKDRSYLLSYLEKRFGIPKSVFDDYLLFKKKKSWWLLRDSDFIRTGLQLKVWRVGLKAFKKIGDFIKPTTRMIQLFGNHASAAIMEISEGDLERFAKGEYIPFHRELENGYIILFLEKKVLGLGLLIDGLVRSQIPRKDMEQLINRTNN